MAACCRYADILASIAPETALKAQAQAATEQRPLEDACQPVWQPCGQLDDIVQPQARYGSLRFSQSLWHAKEFVGASAPYRASLLLYE